MLVITGATGFVGTQLVPILAVDYDLMLVGRDIDRLRAAFPSHDTCSYDDIVSTAARYDALLNLAAMNNDQDAGAEEFHRINVDFVCRIAAWSKQASITRFIQLSSTHALSPSPGDHYARSKRQGDIALQAANLDCLVIVYAPAIHGDRLQGNLKRLSVLPNWLRRPLMAALVMLRPAVTVADLATILRKVIEEPCHDRSRTIIASTGQRGNRFYSAFKRVLDSVSAMVILALASWLMLGVAILVRVTSRGPAIFAQERVGRDGKLFTCYKFRTMAVGTAHAATHEVSVSAVTGLGKFLRANKLDELPQLYNVLRNEMSLVGPRPCLATQRELIEFRRQMGVLDVLPGITGLAQVRSIDMSHPFNLATADAEYVALRTVPLDLKILFWTLVGKGQGDRTNGDLPGRSKSASRGQPE